jgi:hypothetical protein
LYSGRRSPDIAAGGGGQFVIFMPPVQTWAATGFFCEDKEYFIDATAGRMPIDFDASR